MYPERTKHVLIKIFNGSLVDLPSPSNISYMWNIGSLIRACLGIQIITGIILAIHYSCRIRVAFESVSHIMRDVNYGWLLRAAHANGASFFFVFIYIHIARGLYYGSYHLKITWRVGVIILLAVQATAFLGYVLPWGQISFWGATVITNLVSSIPYIGGNVVEWLWGGFSVDNATLTRFFAFHFLLPFIIRALVAVHLLFLHTTGSNNPLGVDTRIDKIPFHLYFREKDIFGLVKILLLFMCVVLYLPNVFGDPENFIPANSLVTPVHIQPEWYFLFAYAILRAIPNKLGGVIALVCAILVVLVLPFTPKRNFLSLAFYPLGKFYFWSLVITFFLLTYIGAKPVEEPFITLGQLLRIYYFAYFFLASRVNKLWDYLLS